MKHRPFCRSCRFLEEERSRAEEPRSIGSLVGELMQGYAPVLVPLPGAARGSSFDRMEVLERIWRDTVGEGFAAATRVVRYRGGVLTVNVMSAPLLTELGFAREELITALMEQGLEGIHEIQLRTGSGDDHHE